MSRPKTSKNTKSISTISKRKCLHCGRELNDKEFYKSYSCICLKNDNYLPICKNCVQILYEQYRVEYKNQFIVLGNESGKNAIEKLAVKRVCMAFDVYYSDRIFEAALRNQKKFPNMDILSAYFKMTNLKQNKNKTYDNTILEENLSQELLKSSMVNKIRESYVDNELYEDIYNFCLKLLQTLKRNCNIDYSTTD